jgi:hypothetical protein
MCGIAGIYAYRDPAPPVDGDELLRIREHMARRGPDGAGTWLSDDRRIGLAHRRLAIIDLSDAGAQPMASADGRYRITYNGEIYNYRELRRELEAKGCLFRTQSDTEVLLHLYAERGQEMVHALRGMFAFGIWDEARQELFLARDPLGIKPLYYADDGATLRFATLVGALLEGGRVDSVEDVAGIAGFYLFGCVPEPFTFHRAIRALPSGSTLRIGRDGSRGPRQYFSIADEFRKAEAASSTLDAGGIDDHRGTGRHRADAAPHREGLGHAAQQMEADDAGGIGIAADGSAGEQRLGLRGEADRPAVVGVVERLDAVRIAREKHPPLLRIPERESEHPAQIVEHFRTARGVQLQQDFGVRLGREPHAARLET